MVFCSSSECKDAFARVKRGLCLGYLAGRGRSLGRQLLDNIEIPGRLVAIDLGLGKVAGKGELFLMGSPALHTLIAGFRGPQRRRCRG